jgi:hypothetical protein
MGIAIHNVSASSAEPVTNDLAAAIRQEALGLLGTTVQLADLVCTLFFRSHIFQCALLAEMGPV